MSMRRVAAALAVVLAAGQAARAQTVPLAEQAKAGDCFHVRLDLKLTGQIKINQGGKGVALDLKATAGHAFHERVLAVGGLGLPDKVARSYNSANAKISVGKDVSERSLRPRRRLIVAQRHKEQPLVYCPSGPLTRPELELIAEHFDTLTLPGLLAGKTVKPGETWKVGNSPAQALCHFDGLTENKLTGKLEGVAGKLATFSVTGSAAGVELGAMVKVKVEAKGQFDLGSKRLVRLEWKQSDDRDQGPASPASTGEVTVTLTRTPVKQPEALSDVALISVPAGYAPPAPMTNVEHRDAKGRFAFLHGREWVLVGETPEHTVLRLVDQGDFVAQLTVTPWAKAEKGKHLTEVEFKRAMHTSPGWAPERELQAGVAPSGGDRWVYRLSELGQLDGTQVLQNFFLVAGPDGDQVVLAFTLSPRMADKLGPRDLAIAASFEVPAPR